MHERRPHGSGLFHVLATTSFEGLIPTFSGPAPWLSMAAGTKFFDSGGARVGHEIQMPKKASLRNTH